MKDKYHITLTSLGNAVELGARVVQEVAGNEASDQVGGRQIKETVKDTLAARMSKSLMIDGGKA